MTKSISTNLLGEHNVQNLIAAVSVIDDLGYEIKKKHILKFKGTKRRLNILGKLKKTLLIDDYAHHPTEIAKLINILNLYKTKNIFLVVTPTTINTIRDVCN